jgi:hypothetical protein
MIVHEEGKNMPVPSKGASITGRRGKKMATRSIVAELTVAHSKDRAVRHRDREQLWRLAILDATPELPLCCDDQVLLERIGVDPDLHLGSHRS